jgi:microsomal epoxide hydrolase
MHARSARPDALPLLLTHGWPGSVAEFLKVIAPLRQDFHVVVPSIPGYGLSGPTRQTGWDVPRIARAWAELMSRLGYRRYGLHGGDWGAFISRELGRIRAEHVTGVHLTFVPAPPAVDADALSEVDQRKLARKRQYLQTEYGYGFIQATKPQTLAYGLTDSPVGQLAWIVEKFKGWTDSTDVPEDAVDRDQMLTNVMLYWLTGTAGSAARLYRESAATIAAAPLPSSTPTGVAQFPRDQAANIRPIAETLNNITRWTEFDRGGHFPAMEEPDLLVADIQQFFGQYRH